MSRVFRPVAILCAVALLGVSLPAMSQTDPAPPDNGKRGHFGPGPQMMMEHLAEKLDLSDSQKVQFQGIVAKYHTGSAGEVMKSFHQATAQLESLVRDPGASEDQIAGAARALSAQAELAAIQRHRMAVEIDSILTDAQRQKARDLQTEGAGGPMGFHHRRGGPPPSQGE